MLDGNSPNSTALHVAVEALRSVSDPKPTEGRFAYMLENVDLRPIKKLVREHVPLGSKFRKVVEAEPEWIPRYAVLGKILPGQTLMRDELDDQ